MKKEQALELFREMGEHPQLQVGTYAPNKYCVQFIKVIENNDNGPFFIWLEVRKRIYLRRFYYTLMAFLTANDALDGNENVFTCVATHDGDEFDFDIAHEIAMSIDNSDLLAHLRTHGFKKDHEIWQMVSACPPARTPQWVKYVLDICGYISKLKKRPVMRVLKHVREDCGKQPR